MGQRRADKSEMLAKVNGSILGAARGSPSGEKIWEFFCECGEEGCREYVRLSLDAYAALHDGGGAVLADGHQLSEVERSRRLGADAEALRHQAAHQLRRARKNLRRPRT